MEPYRVVLTTVSSLEEAKRIAHSLVEARLAACVNIAGNVESVYRWQGAVEEAQEVLLLIKTRVEKLGELEAAVRRLHPYEVPEFVILKVDGAVPRICGGSMNRSNSIWQFVILKVAHACALCCFRAEHYCPHLYGSCGCPAHTPARSAEGTASRGSGRTRNRFEIRFRVASRF